MSEEQKPKVEGKKPRQPTKPQKKEYTTRMVGLEEDTFDIGHPKYAAKYERSVDAIARYVQQEYRLGTEVARGMRELVTPTVTMPVYPSDPNDQEKIQIWKEELQEKRTQVIQIDKSTKRAYTLVMGQCSPAMVSKIRGANSYAIVNAAQNVVELLRLIRDFCCHFGAGQQSTWALEQAKHKVSIYYQKHDVSNTDYIQYFQALVGVLETYGGAYGNEPGLINAHLIDQGVPADRLDSATQQHIADAKAACCDAYLACMLLCGADSIRYWALKTKLVNDMTKGQDHYPKTIVEATRLLNDYKLSHCVQRARDDPGEGVAFVQDRGNKREGSDEGVGGNGGQDAKNPNFWHCNQPGHHMNRCPELAVKGVDNFNIDELDRGHGFFSTAMGSTAMGAPKDVGSPRMSAHRSGATRPRNTLWPNRRRRGPGCEASYTVTICTLTRVPAMQAHHTVPCWITSTGQTGDWWDTATAVLRR